MQHVNLRAVRRFTGHWPPHRLHTAVSSVNCIDISRKLKSTCQDQNNVSTSFLSIIYDNLYQYQPMMSPVAVDIDKSDFFLPLGGGGVGVGGWEGGGGVCGGWGGGGGWVGGWGGWGGGGGGGGGWGGWGGVGVGGVAFISFLTVIQCFV